MDEVLKRLNATLLTPTIALVLVASCAVGHTQTRVVDGDTLKIDGQLVRLYGIDAPEGRQTCDDGAWQPGPLATRALQDFIGDRTVECRQVSYDGRNKRPVSVCYAGGTDLQALMVEAGWAWAYVAYSLDYVEAERTAATRGLGVHAHRCEKPWEWRAQRRHGN